MFYLFAALLTVVALLFVILPLLRKQPEHKTIDRKAENLRAYKQQLHELKQASEAGEFSDDEREQIENELKLRLLEDTQAADNARSLNTNKPWVFTGALSVLLVIFAAWFFVSENNLAEVELQELMAEANQGPDAQNRFLDLALENLQKNPDDVEGWWTLGRNYMTVGRADDAVGAYENALAALERLPEVFDEDRSVLMAHIVQANFFANDRQLNNDDRQMLQSAITLFPENSMALGISGLAAFESGNYEQAIISWRQLGRISPQEAQSVASAIAAAESRLLEAGRPIPKDDFAAEAVDGPIIIVSLDIDPELSAKALNAQSIYVLARAAGGPPMPLAVKRLHTTLMPVKVQLDSSAAMGPMAGIKTGDRVEIVARLSMSGSANGAPGDIEAVSEPIVLEEGQQQIKLTLDSIRQ